MESNKSNHDNNNVNYTNDNNTITALNVFPRGHGRDGQQLSQSSLEQLQHELMVKEDLLNKKAIEIEQKSASLEIEQKRLEFRTEKLEADFQFRTQKLEADLQFRTEKLEFSQQQFELRQQQQQQSEQKLELDKKLFEIDQRQFALDKQQQKQEQKQSQLDSLHCRHCGYNDNTKHDSYNSPFPPPLESGSSSLSSIPATTATQNALLLLPLVTPEQQLCSSVLLSEEGKIASMMIEQSTEQYSVMMTEAQQRMLDAERKMRKVERRAIMVRKYENDIVKRGEELDIRMTDIEGMENEFVKCNKELALYKTHLEESKNVCVKKDKIIAKNAVQIAVLQGRIDILLKNRPHRPKRPTIQLFVKQLGGTINITCHNNASVKDLKELIYGQEGIPCEQQLLIFAGEQLCDDRTLKEYNVEDQCTFHLLLNLPAALYPEFFFDQ